MASSNGDRYLVGAFLQACQIMEAFRKRNEVLRLRDVVARTGLTKATAFRLLYTLHQTGFVEKTGPNEYRLRFTLPKRSRHRLGYDGNTKDPFTAVVTESLVQAAADGSVELLILDNRDGKLSLQNAQSFIRERVDLVIEFQGNQAIAGELAAKFAEAEIPVIAIDVPHAGAYFFGANNYRAGLLAGHEMGRWAKLNWPDAMPDVLLIEYKRAGSVPQSRVAGMLAGFKETFRDHEKCSVFRLDSIGDYQSGYDAVQLHLRGRAPQKTLIGAVNDPAALGAIRACEQARLGELCAVVSQDAEPGVRAEMRRPGSRMIGSVAYFPEKYGGSIINLAHRILAGPPPPLVTFTRHLLVTPENVDHVYPNDSLLNTPVANG